MLIVTFGSEGRAVDDLSRVADKHQVDLVIDMRLTAASRDRSWGPVELQKRFGSRYLAARGMAVKDMRSELAAHGRPHFVNLHEGLRTFARRFASDRAWLFLGDAPDPMHDARGHVAMRFQDELSGIVVIHDMPETTTTQERLL